MRVLFRSFLVSAGLLALAAATPTEARAGGQVGVLVLKEHGVGTAAQAQPFLDKFVAIAAKVNGWESAKGSFQTTRKGADTFVQAESPHYGIFSVGAFLGSRDKYKLDVIGSVSIAGAGGQQYHLISKSAGDLAGCKGQTLATDHGDDATFINGVIFGGKAKLGDFTVVATTRPTQTLKKVVAGEAVCALIDDAQLSELGHLEGAAGVKSVWASDKLPPMVVVAFPAAPADERKAFQGSFGRLCSTDAQACSDVGIQSFKSASNTDYAAVIAAYK